MGSLVGAATMRRFKYAPIIEPRREKTGVLLMENRDADQLLISAFVFVTRMVQSLYFLNPKFQASSPLQWLYSPVCVGPGRKPQIPVF